MNLVFAGTHTHLCAQKPVLQYVSTLARRHAHPTSQYTPPSTQRNIPELGRTASKNSSSQVRNAQTACIPMQTAKAMHAAASAIEAVSSCKQTNERTNGLVFIGSPTSSLKTLDCARECVDTCNQPGSSTPSSLLGNKQNKQQIYVLVLSKRTTIDQIIKQQTINRLPPSDPITTSHR